MLAQSRNNRTNSLAIEKLSSQLQELVLEIQSQTKQPALIDDIIRYTQSVISTMHRLDNFWRDIDVFAWEATSGPAYARSIDLADSAFPKHRQILAVSAKGGTKPLTKVSVQDALQAVARNRQNCWYQLGSKLHVKTTWEHNELIIALLSKPDFSDLSKFHSWIAEEHPHLVIDAVSAMIYADTGQSDKQSAATTRVELLHKPELFREQLYNTEMEILTSDVLAQYE